MSRPAISYPIPASNGGGNSFDDHSSQRSLLFEGSNRDSTASSRQSAGGSRGPTSTLDSFITRLLVVTKQLLQGLEQWSSGQLSEEEVMIAGFLVDNQVSDIYVRLGNGFELCVAAFRRVGISTTDLDSVPRDLREILERALAEEPSTDTLNIYLPDIRAIIFNLLSGLKNKQTSYKRLQADRQQQPEVFTTAPNRPSRLDAKSPDGGSPSSVSSQATATGRAPPTAALAERTSQRSIGPRPPPPDAFRPTRSRPSNESFTGRVFQDTLPNQPAPYQNTSPSTAVSSGSNRPPSRPPRSSRDSFGKGHVSRFSADSDVSVDSSRRPSSGDKSADKDKTPTTMSPAASINSIPPSMPTISLSTQTEMFPEPHPTPAEQPIPASTLRTLPSLPTLDRLHSADPLTRRASKRFSSYTFNKMLPSSPSSKLATSSSPQRPTRRPDRLPPMPSVQEDGRPLSQLSQLHPVVSHSSTGSSPPEENHLGSIAERPTSSLGDELDARSERRRSTETAPSPAPTIPGSVSVFLQLGRKVKKTRIEVPATMPGLRLLFMERFEYNLGMEDFPDVYIRDNRTGVQYELEDMDDLREGCVLTLDVEPLDQVKQHFDTTIATLAQEMKEFKTTLAASRRMSMQIPPHLAAPHASMSPQMRPSDRTPDQAIPRTLPQPQRTASGSSIAPSVDLTRHHKEVQDLRTDLAVLRQIHVDFLTQTKEAFTHLRNENSAMREVVKTKMGGNRALLDNSKAKLDAQCQDTIQAVEEISDIIDGAREDALRRGVTPSRAKMDKIKKDLTNATNLVDQFSNDVTLADPTWRATWLTELQRVTEEQRLLAYQNKLATDLKNDIKDAAEMLENVNAFVVQRSAAGSTKTFRPPTPEEGGGSFGNVLMQIRNNQTDPEQRLKAIEDQRKARERDLAVKQDEFQNELSGFVEGKKLRRTGGTDEADRVRQRRQDQTIMRMLSGDLPGEQPGVITPQGTGNQHRSG